MYTIIAQSYKNPAEREKRGGLLRKIIHICSTKIYLL